MVEREKHLGQTEGTLEFSEKPLLLGTVDLLVEVGGRDRDGVGVGAAVVGAVARGPRGRLLHGLREAKVAEHVTDAAHGLLTGILRVLLIFLVPRVPGVRVVPGRAAAPPPRRPQRALQDTRLPGILTPDTDTILFDYVTFFYFGNGSSGNASQHCPVQ